MKPYLYLLLIGFFLSSCSNKLLLGKSQGKFYDEYIVFRENGKYRQYTRFFINMTTDKGHFAASGDTIYLAHKSRGNFYVYEGFALIENQGTRLSMYMTVDSLNMEYIILEQSNKLRK